ncbi:MAG: hypothetical protein ACLFU8_07115 [Anaerolineales bacterium]
MWIWVIDDSNFRNTELPARHLDAALEEGATEPVHLVAAEKAGLPEGVDLSVAGGPTDRAQAWGRKLLSEPGQQVHQ